MVEERLTNILWKYKIFLDYWLNSSKIMKSMLGSGLFLAYNEKHRRHKDGRSHTKHGR